MSGQYQSVLALMVLGSVFTGTDSLILWEIGGLEGKTAPSAQRNPSGSRDTSPGLTSEEAS